MTGKSTTNKSTTGKSTTGKNTTGKNTSDGALSATALPDDIAAMTFEDAMVALEDIVHTLEDGECGLEESIKACERGALLKWHCEQKLKEARLSVEKIVSGDDGTISTGDFSE